MLIACFELIKTEVPVFHAYAHEYACQEKFNPFMTPGSGLTNFEDCERVFSYTNKMAYVSRHTTAYHRHQQLEWCINHWNQIKLTNLGKSMLLLKT